MELFDKRFVIFVWDDGLQGKEGFFADFIDQLRNNVNNNEWTNIVSKSDTDRLPFHERDCNWQFFYYDPNYKCKLAYSEGKQIQILYKGDWIDCYDPEWVDDVEYRIKPEEPKSRRMTYRELAEWLAKGNGQAKAGRCAITQLIYSNFDKIDNMEIPEEYKIRRWNSNEWIEPTYDIYIADCGKENSK